MAVNACGQKRLTPSHFSAHVLFLSRVPAAPARGVKFMYWPDLLSLLGPSRAECETGFVPVYADGGDGGGDSDALACEGV